MSEDQTRPCFDVTEAFESQLKTLCIKEFPCGYGSWVGLVCAADCSIRVCKLTNVQVVFFLFFQRVPDVGSDITLKSTIPSPHVVISNTGKQFSPSNITLENF